MRAALAVLLLAPALALASGTERFREFIRETQSARADFGQKVYDRERRLTQEARGTFSFRRPGRFRWATAQPYEQLIVGDGERVWIYDPDLRQVTVRSMGTNTCRPVLPDVFTTARNDIALSKSLIQNATRLPTVNPLGLSSGSAPGASLPE